MKSVGENIALLRKKAGLTQEELSEKMNVTAQAVSKWENDLSYPDLANIRSMAELFGVTVDELLNGPREITELKSEDPETVGKRIMHIYVKTNECTINVRIPVSLILNAIDNGTLEKLVGEEAEQIEMVSEIIRAGTVGTIVSTEAENNEVKITVEDYEG